MRLLFVFLFLCGGTSHAFSLVSHRRSSARRAPLQTGICRAKPGQSEAEAKAERALEISNKIAALKSAGKFKDNAEETMMQEAEQFMNKESPMAKFERRAQERKEQEAQERIDAPAPASPEQDRPDEGPPAEDTDGTDPATMDGSVDPIPEGGAADPPKKEGSFWDRLRASL